MLLSLVVFGASAFATSPIRPTYMYGAIAYRTVPASYFSAATYQVGTAGGYVDAYDAAYRAQRDCGAGCGYFTFYNACAGIAFTAGHFGAVANYGYLTTIQYYNGNSMDSTRSRVRAELERQCRRSGVRCEEIVTECAY